MKIICVINNMGNIGNLFREYLSNSFTIFHNRMKLASNTTYNMIDSLS